MDETRLESLLTEWLDGALDEAGERELLDLLQAAPPGTREAASRNALADRLLRVAARGPLDAEAVLRALPARSGSRLESRVMRHIRTTTVRPRRRLLPRAAHDLRWLPAAALLLVALTATAWLALRHRDPARSAPRYALLVGGSPVARGCLVTTGDGPVRVDLGGYCRLRLDPMSVISIEGRERAEEVVLERGHVACDVEPGHGTFSIRTEVGTVTVLGTSFETALEDANPARPGTWRRLVVAVSSGTVRLAGPGGDRLVRAGETAAVVPPPPAGEYVPDAEGFVRHWLLLGPVPLDTWVRDHTEAVEKPILDAPLGPGPVAERPRAGDRADVKGRRFVWRPHAAGGAAVDLEAFAHTVGGEDDNAIFLGVAYVVCDREIPGARLSIGSDDSSTWRLNGREVVRVYTNHAVGRDQDRSEPLTLRKGVNVLAFTVINGDGPTGACARFFDAAGEPIRDFTVTLTPPANGP
jgi:ferric-dicitrate binding protein FerR (iron transport regulator)